MPKYRVRDAETGRSLLLEGDSPPTEQELVQIFASQSKSSGPHTESIGEPTETATDAPVAPLINIKLSPYQQADLATGGKAPTGMESGTEFTTALATGIPKDIDRAESAVKSAVVAAIDSPPNIWNRIKGLKPGMRGYVPPIGDALLTDAGAAAVKPLVPIPKFESKPGDSLWLTATKEATNMLLGIPEFLETPLGAATGGIGTAGKTGASLVRYAFAADMIKTMAQQEPDIIANWNERSDAENTKQITRFLGTGVMAGLLTHPEWSAKPERPAVQGPAATGESLRQPSGAVPPAAVDALKQANAPMTAQALVETALPAKDVDPNKALEQSIENGKSTDLPSDIKRVGPLPDKEVADARFRLQNEFAPRHSAADLERFNRGDEKVVEEMRLREQAAHRAAAVFLQRFDTDQLPQLMADENRVAIEAGEDPELHPRGHLDMAAVEWLRRKGKIRPPEEKPSTEAKALERPAESGDEASSKPLSDAFEKHHGRAPTPEELSRLRSGNIELPQAEVAEPPSAPPETKPETGKPIIIQAHHGSKFKSDYSPFDESRMGSGWKSRAIHLAVDPKYASSYASGYGYQKQLPGGTTTSWDVSLVNPKVVFEPRSTVNYTSDIAKATALAQSEGHDGVIFTDLKGKLVDVAVFKSESVKPTTRPIPSADVESNKITLPEGYSKRGAQYVYEQQPTTTSAPAEAKEPWQMTRAEFRTMRHAETTGRGDVSTYDLEHRIKVREALLAGKEIPPEVLADYPDLNEPAKSAEPTPEPETTSKQPDSLDLGPLIDQPKEKKGLPAERSQIVRMLESLEDEDSRTGEVSPKSGQEDRVKKLRARLSVIEKSLAGEPEKAVSEKPLSLLEFAKSKLSPEQASKITSESQVESFRAQWEKESKGANAGELIADASGLKGGDMIEWVPNAAESKYNRPIKGMVSQVLPGSGGGFRVDILAPLPGDASRTISVWDTRGSIRMLSGGDLREKPQQVPPHPVDSSSFLSVPIPDTAEAETAATYAERQIDSLRKERQQVEEQIKELGKPILTTRGRAYQRGQIKKSAKAADVKAYQDAQKKAQEIGRNADAIMAASGKDRIAKNEADLARRVNDPKAPLVERLGARQRLYEKAGAVPPEFAKAFDEAATQAILKQYPDATGEEIAQMLPITKATAEHGSVESSFRMDPRMQINTLRQTEIFDGLRESAGDRTMLPREELPKELADELDRKLPGWESGYYDKNTARGAIKGSTEPISAMDVARLGAEIDKAASAIMARREADRMVEEGKKSEEARQIALAEEQAKGMVVEAQKIVGTASGRTGAAIKDDLIERIEKAIEEAPDELGGDGKTRRIAIGVPGDGVFVLTNTKADLKAVLERASKIPTTKGDSVSKGFGQAKASVPQPPKPFKSDAELIKLLKSDFVDPEDSVRTTLQDVHSDGKVVTATNGKMAVKVTLSTEGNANNPEGFPLEKISQYTDKAESAASITVSVEDLWRAARMAQRLDWGGNYPKADFWISKDGVVFAEAVDPEGDYGSWGVKGDGVIKMPTVNSHLIEQLAHLAKRLGNDRIKIGSFEDKAGEEVSELMAFKGDRLTGAVMEIKEKAAPTPEAKPDSEPAASEPAADQGTVQDVWRDQYSNLLSKLRETTGSGSGLSVGQEAVRIAQLLEIPKVEVAKHLAERGMKEHNIEYALKNYKEPGESEPESTGENQERADVIEKIVAAERPPNPEIVPSIELKGNDGKWYRGFGVPPSVKTTGETRIAGYVIRTPQGTTVGVMGDTAEAVLKRWSDSQDRRSADFRKELQGMDDARLESQRKYWLKETESASPDPVAPAWLKSPEKKAFDNALQSIKTVKDYAPREAQSISQSRRKSIERADITMRRAAEVLGIELPRRSTYYSPESDLANAQKMESAMRELANEPKESTAPTPSPKKSGKKLLAPNQISDFRPGIDRVERQGDRTFVVDSEGQRAAVEVQSDKMTPEAADRIRNLPTDKVAMARATTESTPYLSKEGKVERLAVFDEKKDINTGKLGNVGMGGAKPGEFEGSPNTPTSTKNKVVDEERIKRGLPPAMQPARRELGTVWDEAMARIDQDPDVQDKLFGKLREKPRALTDLENALLLHRQIELQNQYGRATRELAQAFDDAKEFPNRLEAVEEGRLEVARLSDQLYDLYNLGKKVGTETGRGLNARKMMAYEDFTLAHMELEKRAANGGRPMTDAERTQLTELQQKIEATQKAYDEYVAKTDARIAEMAMAHKLLELKVQSVPKFDKRILDYAETVVSRMEKAAAPAAARIRERLMRMGSGPDPTLLYDLSIVGSAKIARLGLDLAKFTDAMVKDFGDKIKPFINDVWDASNKMLESTLAKVPSAVKRVVKTQDIGERETAITDTIKKRVDEGKRNEIAGMVQKLARLFVERGIKERDPLIDAVHHVLRTIDPDFTRRETMDAISGYGDFRQLTKDQISVELRDLKGQMQQVSKLEDMQMGKPPVKTGLERRVPSREESRLIKLVNEAKQKFQIPITDPDTQLKSSLDTLKTSIANRTMELEEKLANKDFAPRVKRELHLDAEALRLKAEHERAKQEFQAGLIADRLKNRTWWEKALDWGTKWRRAGVLSSPVVIPKLISAGIQRMAFSPVEEVLGSAWGRLPGIAGIARRAPLESGTNLHAEANAFTKAFTKGMTDAWQVLRTGKSDLDAIYGKPDATYTGEPSLGRNPLEFFGRLHGLVKAPVKRAAFERATVKLTDFYLRQGLNPAEPMTAMRIGTEAYKAANRAIFLQDNFVADRVKRFVNSFEEKSKITGRPTALGKTISTAGRVAMPILRVPTNIVAETLQYAGGLITGGARVARALSKGVDTLTPEEADLIMRDLKKGSIGAAFLTLGYLSPEVVGGYYQPGKKQTPGDVKYGSIRVYGHDIPSVLLHNPLLETIQLGATIRRVSDSYLRKKDTETQGLPAGVMAGVLGLTEEVPFIREMTEVEKLRNPYTRGGWINEQIKSILIPQVVQWLAKQMDKDTEGETVKRDPKTLGEHLETGIPGMRGNVPVKKGAPQPAE